MPFDIFQLPPELRHLIWKFAMPGPRTIRINYRNDVFKLNKITARLRIPENVLEYQSNVKAPALLHVCQESRIEMQKSYKLVFKSVCSPRLIYFNFEIDILLFSKEHKYNHSLYAFLRCPYETSGILVKPCTEVALDPSRRFPEAPNNVKHEGFNMHCFLATTAPKEIAQIRRVAQYAKKRHGRDCHLNPVAMHLFRGLLEWILVTPESRSPGPPGFNDMRIVFPREHHPGMVRKDEYWKEYEEDALFRLKKLTLLKNLDYKELQHHPYNRGEPIAHLVKKELAEREQRARERELGVFMPSREGWWARWNIPEIKVGLVIDGRRE